MIPGQVHGEDETDHRPLTRVLARHGPASTSHAGRGKGHDCASMSSTKNTRDDVHPHRQVSVDRGATRGSQSQQLDIGDPTCTMAMPET